jgi:parvulin-like peptidyl-prolyl isomerase
MATFKNAELNLTATAADVYTCPAATTAIVMGMQVTNVHATTDAEVTVQWTDDSNSDKVTKLAADYLLEAKLAFSPVVVGKLVLEAGDKLQAFADAINLAEMTVSVLELST